MTDNDLMPFGEHKGQALVNVPASRLIWYYENILTLEPGLKAYIRDNLDVLKSQAKATVRNNRR